MPKPHISTLLCALACILMLVSAYASAADAIEGEEFCDAAIDRVEFSGNNKTQVSVLQREILTKANAPCSLDHIIDSVQGIMDLRLFKRVSPRLWKDDEELVLTYQVEEKIYFLPLPRFSRTSDGELRYGAQLRWDNFMGLHHRVKFTGERRRQDDGAGREGSVTQFSYIVPRFLGSRQGMSLIWKHTQQESQLDRDEVIHGESNLETQVFGLSFSRWLNIRGATRGLSYFIGAAWQSRHHRLISGELGPFEEGRDTVLSVGIAERQESDDLYRLRGYRYGANINHASPATGSDYRYTSANLYYVRYVPVHPNGLRNFNYRIQLGFSDGGPFGERLYSLGGGNQHRGLPPGSRDGDILTLFNAEYLMGLADHPAVRGVVFADVGNVFTYNNVDLFRQKIGVGLGLRWKILALSNTDLRADIAYSRDLGEARFFFATNLTF